MASRPVADLPAVRFDKLEAENAAARQKVAESDARIAAFCRKWSDDNGYRMVCSRDQVRLAMGRG